MKTGTLVRRYEGVPDDWSEWSGPIESDVAVSQDGRTALCRLDPYRTSISALDLDTGVWEGDLFRLSPVDVSFWTYWSAAWFADNRHVLFVGGKPGSRGQFIGLFDTKGRCVVCSMVRQEDSFTSAAISSDGRLALLGSEDGTIQLWGLPDPVDPRQLASFVAYCALNHHQVGS